MAGSIKRNLGKSRGWNWLAAALMAALAAALMAAPRPASAGDVFLRAAFTDLKLTRGEWPTSPVMENRNWRGMGSGATQWIRPYGVLGGPGEIYIGSQDPYLWWRRDVHEILTQSYAAIKISEGDAPTSGRFYIPRPDWKGMMSVDFAIPKASGDREAARKAFFQAKEEHYQRLMDLGAAGGAWFRHERNEARRERLGVDADKQTSSGFERQPWNRRPSADSEFEETYSLFSGGRALSENLQLDRELRTAPDGAETVDLATISGISVAPIDWKPLVANLNPSRDSLARAIPADQHAVFFPSFSAFMLLMDETKAHGTPVLRLLEDRSEDERVSERYERQLCLSPNLLSRVMGPKLVKSVAFTGGDPFLWMGADVAVLFEASDAAALKLSIAARQAAAVSGGSGAKSISGKAAGVDYSGAVSPDRAVCSYLMAQGNVVIVTNSLAQLERILDAMNGKSPNLASQDEYTYFRDRYRLGDADETALLVLTDATIRRWCGPRWRIADSRRTRLAAALAEVQARQLDALASGQAKAGAIEVPPPVPGAGRIELTSRGASSEVYGAPGFLTPILEIPLARVTRREADAYARFRDNYQRNWRQFFDPIAVRFSVKPGAVAMDMTVRPLIANSEYAELIQVTGNAAITANSGDPHAESIFHLVFSLNRESESVRRLGGFATQMAPGIKTNAFSWLGGWLAIYLDQDPLWKELAEAMRKGAHETQEQFMEHHIHRLPLAVHVDVSNAFALTAFLASLRGFIEQTSPGMTAWETRTHAGATYVRAGPSAEGRSSMPEGMQDIALYYAPSPHSLILTLSEPLLKRALERQAARKTAADSATTGTAQSAQARAKGKAALSSADGASSDSAVNEWLGQSVALRLQRDAIPVLQALMNEELADKFEARSWSNLPILTEWRRRYGAQTSPVEFHERWWGARPVCPGGGKYIWNEEFQTMESTVFGCPAHPLAPRDALRFLPPITGGDLGLTFENNGLRARAKLSRAKP